MSVPASAQRLLSTGLGAIRSTASAAVTDIFGSRPADPLDERDPNFIRATLPTYSLLARLYFRPKVLGLEYIPAEGPVLLVGNHSGGTLIADTFAFAFAFYAYFGAERRFHQLAHDLVFALPGLATLRKYGTIPASHHNAERALAAGAALLVYPGGDRETYRPSWRSSEIQFGDRSGFVRLALAHGASIVPVVAIGGQETALFVTRGQRMARLLRLDRLLRLKVLPIQVAPPFGVTVLDLPGRIPLPAQITIQVLPAIELLEAFGPDPDEGEVYSAVTDQMQQALSELAEERDLPVVGSIGARSPQSAVVTALADDQIDRARIGDTLEDEPWKGYAQMRVDEIVRRLRRQGDDSLAAVRSYEQARKARKGVLLEVDRERARRSGPADDQRSPR